MNFRLDLHGPSTRDKRPAGAHGASPWFEVDDLAGAVADLRRQGIEVPEPRRESNSPLFTSFSDPDGNEIGLTAAD